MKKLKSALKIILPLVFITAVTATVYAIPKVIKISRIDCATQFGPCSEDIANKLSAIEGKDLPQTKSEVDNYLENLSFVSKHNTRFLLLSTLKVDLLVKKAQYSIHNEYGQLALVDKDGYVLSYNEASLLPSLETSTPPPSVGDKVDDKELFSLKLLGYLNRMYGVDKGQFQRESLLVKLNPGPRVIFPVGGDEKVLVGGLVLIMNQLNNTAVDSKMKIDCGANCTVDLRFKNPVIKI